MHPKPDAVPHADRNHNQNEDAGQKQGEEEPTPEGMEPMRRDTPAAIGNQDGQSG